LLALFIKGRKRKATRHAECALTTREKNIFCFKLKILIPRWLKMTRKVINNSIFSVRANV